MYVRNTSPSISKKTTCTHLIIVTKAKNNAHIYTFDFFIAESSFFSQVRMLNANRRNAVSIYCRRLKAILMKKQKLFPDSASI